jgi:hypothetical protein
MTGSWAIGRQRPANDDDASVESEVGWKKVKKDILEAKCDFWMLVQASVEFNNSLPDALESGATVVSPEPKDGGAKASHPDGELAGLARMFATVLRSSPSETLSSLMEKFVLSSGSSVDRSNDVALGRRFEVYEVEAVRVGEQSGNMSAALKVCFEAACRQRDDTPSALRPILTVLSAGMIGVVVGLALAMWWYVSAIPHH